MDGARTHVIGIGLNVFDPSTTPPEPLRERAGSMQSAGAAFRDLGDAAGADGTAGDGDPLVGATIRLTDATGRTTTAVTDSQGYYRMNVTRMTAPFTLMLTTADGKPYHHGYTLATPKARGWCWARKCR